MSTFTPMLFAVVALMPCAVGTASQDQPTRVPILYSTDLHHPHVDPDDHFDLATLFSLAEFDIRGIVLDCGARQRTAPGRIPVEQLQRLTGRSVRWADGLSDRLRSASDAAGDQPAEFQRGVELILSELRGSQEKVTVFTTGSLRDVAAAFNREPDLLRQKISRLYVNIGNPATGRGDVKNEYNVGLDPWAYVRILDSGLPVYWCPCFDGELWQRGVHGTYWKFTQQQVLEAAPLRLQNWFVFALLKPSGVDALGFLDAPQDRAQREKVWRMSRNMWCTAPFLHAAGRRIYALGGGDFIALGSEQAARQGLEAAVVDAFEFVPLHMSATADAGEPVRVTLNLHTARPNGYVFEVRTENYDQVLTACLMHVLKGFPDAGG